MAPLSCRKPMKSKRRGGQLKMTGFNHAHKKDSNVSANCKRIRAKARRAGNF